MLWAAPGTAGPPSGGIVVLPVLADSQGPSPQADAIRRKLTAEGAVGVLDEAQTKARLAALVPAAKSDLAPIQAKLDQAEEAFAAFDAQRSLELQREVIAELSASLDVSEEKRTLLEDVRMATVRRLIGTAGPTESGRGETKEGIEARTFLVDMLRQNPRLNLSPERFPPKLRRLLDGARTELAAAGLTGLSVQSTPQQAQVFVEGRVVGLTPLRLPQALAPGRYRIWVEKDGIQSAARVVDVQTETVSLEFDLAFESALDATRVALTPKTPHVPEELAFRVGTSLGATQLILVGIANYDGAQWLYGASFDPGKQETTMRGAVRLDAIGVTDASTQKLAVFLARGTPTELNPSKVPLHRNAVVAASSAPDASATSADESTGLLPWIVAGGATTAVVVVGVGVAAAAGAFYFASLPPGVSIAITLDK